MHFYHWLFSSVQLFSSVHRIIDVEVIATICHEWMPLSLSKHYLYYAQTHIVRTQTCACNRNHCTTCMFEAYGCSIVPFPPCLFDQQINRTLNVRREPFEIFYWFLAQIYTYSSSTINGRKTLRFATFIWQSAQLCVFISFVFCAKFALQIEKYSWTVR